MILFERCEWWSERTRSILSWLVVAVAGLMLVLPQPSRAAVREETIRIPGPINGLQLGLRHAAASSQGKSSSQRTVLILHGSAVPVSGNPDYHFAGQSLMTALAQTGLDVWALDFYGFGESDRYPEMNEPADKHAPLGMADECAAQVLAVMDYLRRTRQLESMMLIGDSGGTLIAGLFASKYPQRVSRLVLFGPVTPFSDAPSPQATLPAYFFATPLSLWSAFKDWSDAAGEPAVLDSNEYNAWAENYLRSDPTSASRNPPSVKIPNGRQADRATIARGQFTYDPSEIHAPTLIVMGEWDAIATFQGAEWLLKSLKQAKSRQLVVIGRGSHTIQYEVERTSLYRVLATFLNEP